MHLIPKILSNWFISLFSCLLAQNLIKSLKFCWFLYFFPSAPQNGSSQLNSSFFCLNSAAKHWVNFSFWSLYFSIAQFFLVLFYIFFFSLLILSIWWYNVLILSLSSFYMVSLVLWYFKQLIWCLCLVSPMSGLPRRQFPLIAFFFFLACAWVFLSCYFLCFIIFGWNLDILNN